MEAAGVPAAPVDAVDGSPPPPLVSEMSTVRKFTLLQVQGQLSDRGKLLSYLRAVSSSGGGSGGQGYQREKPTSWRQELIAAKIGLALLHQALSAYPTTLEQDSAILASSSKGSYSSGGAAAAVIEEAAEAANDPRVVRSAPSISSMCLYVYPEPVFCYRTIDDHFTKSWDNCRESQQKVAFLQEFMVRIRRDEKTVLTDWRTFLVRTQ